MRVFRSVLLADHSHCAKRGLRMGFLNLDSGNQKMKKWMIAAVGLASFAGSAGPADLPGRTYTNAPPPPPPVVTSWTGCYIGAGGGYGMWNQENEAFSPTTGAL